MKDRVIKTLEDLKPLPEVKIGRIVEALEKEACPIICLICVLPFLQPLPLPGAPIILGLIVFLQAIGLIFWNKPIIFRKITNIEVSHKTIFRIFNGAIKLNWLTTKFSAYKHPIVSTRWSSCLGGMALLFCAIFLLLPLPIPFSNFLPSLSILLISIGLLEDDIILISLGHGLTLTLLSMVIFSYNIIIEQILS